MGEHLLEKAVDFVREYFPRGTPSPTRTELTRIAQDSIGKAVLKDVLKVLLRVGYLKRKGRRYIASPKYIITVARIVKNGGSPVVVCEQDRELVLEYSENVFFQAGDRIAVMVRASSRRRQRAVYLWHVERRNAEVVGSVRQQRKGFVLKVSGGKIVFPVAKGLPGFKAGFIVRAVLHDRPGRTWAEVKKVIGKEGDAEAEVRAVLVKNGMPAEHTQEAEEEALRVARRPVRILREDLRDIPFITLDVDDAKDHDDAVALVKTGGGYVLYVAIADVSSWIRPGSLLDEEAFRRGFTIYYPGGFFPLFPRKLTDEVFSLIPGRDRRALVVEMGLTQDGRLRYYSICPATIRSRVRLFYGEVSQFLAGLGSVPSQVEEMIFEMSRLAQKLRQKRRERGSLDFDLPEQFFVFEGRRLHGIQKRMAEEASHIVEEFMLLANEVVARRIAEENVSSIYRVHPPPDPADIRELETVLAQYGIRWKRPLDRHQLAAVVDFVKGTPQEQVLIMSVLRALKLAVYSAVPAEHFGLALQYYTHFTSPIRRYPDVVVHRVLKRVLDVDDVSPLAEGVGMEEAAERCSLLERRVEEVERELNRFFSAVFMKDRVGERFKGIVSGVIESGVFVELEDPFVEGFAPRRFIRGGPFRYDRKRGVLKDRHGKTIAPGMPVEVEVIRVNPIKRYIDFKLVEFR